MHSFFRVFFAFTAFFCTEQAIAQTSPTPKAPSLYESALKNPGDEAAFKAFLASLPQSKSLFTGETLYILERDQARTAREVRAYLLARQGRAPKETPGELVLHTVLGTPMCWSNPLYRTLRYSVSKPSFVNGQEAPGIDMYTKTVTAMREATGDWMAICPECKIKFEYVPSFDEVSLDGLFDAVGQDQLRFFVYYEAIPPGEKKIYARAFFPGASADERYLHVAQLFIDLLKKTPAKDKLSARGTLRHELGHILGYRHEHILSPDGDFCKAETDALQTPTQIGPYNPKSVMHYDCGRPDKPFGAEDIITRVDIASHKRIYGRQKAGYVCGVKLGAVSSGTAK